MRARDLNVGDIVYDETGVRGVNICAEYKKDWYRNYGKFRVINKDGMNCMQPLDRECNSPGGEYWICTSSQHNFKFLYSEKDMDRLFEI